MNLPNRQKQTNSLKFKAGELEGFRKVLEYLWDGNQEAFNALLYIKQTYRDWGRIFIWLKDNELRGNKLMDFFKNESPDGGGYLSGIEHIMTRLGGNKHGHDGIKMDNLL